MRDVHSGNFGLMIAYIVPGFTALWGASYFSKTIHLWLKGSSVDGPTIGGFLYVTLAAVAAGLTVSTVRWAVIDTLHHKTGIPRPKWDFSRLQQHFDAYDRLEHNHYAYYKAYSNMIVALLFLFVAGCSNFGCFRDGWSDAAILAIAAIFYGASRDTLAKYYDRTTQLLTAPQEPEPTAKMEASPAQDGDSRDAAPDASLKSRVDQEGG